MPRVNQEIVVYNPINNTLVVETMREGGFSSNAAAAIFYDCNILATVFAKVTYEYCLREAIFFLKREQISLVSIYLLRRRELPI
jgi:hypothetical protein